ncbi:FK506-binding protein 5-like [Arapaima gigas]
MEFPVDFLTASSHEDLEEAGKRFVSALLQGNPDNEECFMLPDFTQVPINLSTVGFISLYGGDSEQKILALFDPQKNATAVALYLANQWWAVEDILKTANPIRKGLLKVQTLGERIVLYILNCVVYRAHEIGTDEVPFLCHTKDDFVKILWNDGKAIGFYSVKPKDSSYGNSLTQVYQLPVMNSMFVRNSYRGNQYGLQLLEDFVQSFREDLVGVDSPLSPFMYKACEEYLSMYPEDKYLLWGVRGVGGPYQRFSIAQKILNMSVRGRTLQECSESTEMVVEEKAEKQPMTHFMEEEVVTVTRHARVREAIDDTPVLAHPRTTDLGQKRLRGRSEQVIVESTPDKMNRMEYVEEIVEVPLEMLMDAEDDGEQDCSEGQVGQGMTQEEHLEGKLSLETQLLEKKKSTMNSDFMVSVSADTNKDSLTDVTEEVVIAEVSTEETMEVEKIVEQEASRDEVAPIPISLPDKAVEKWNPPEQTEPLTGGLEATTEEPFKELLEEATSLTATEEDQNKSRSKIKEPTSMDVCQVLLMSQKEASFKPLESDEINQIASDLEMGEEKKNEKESEMDEMLNTKETVAEHDEEWKDNDEEKTEAVANDRETTAVSLKKGCKRSTEVTSQAQRQQDNDSDPSSIDKAASNMSKGMKADRKQSDETVVAVRVLRGKTKMRICEMPIPKYNKAEKKRSGNNQRQTQQLKENEVKSKLVEMAGNAEEKRVEDKTGKSIKQNIEIEDIADGKHECTVLGTEEDVVMEIMEKDIGNKGAMVVEVVEKEAKEIGKEEHLEEHSSTEIEVEDKKTEKDNLENVEISVEEQEDVGMKENEKQKDTQVNEAVKISATGKVVAREAIVEQRVLCKGALKSGKRKACPSGTPRRKSRRLCKQPIQDYKDDLVTMDENEKEQPGSTAAEGEIEDCITNISVAEESNTVGKRTLRPRPQKLIVNTTPKVTMKCRSKHVLKRPTQEYKDDLPIVDEEKGEKVTKVSEEKMGALTASLNLSEDPVNIETGVVRNCSEKVKADVAPEETHLSDQPAQEYKDTLSIMDEEETEKNSTTGKGDSPERNEGSTEQEGETVVCETNEMTLVLDVFQEETRGQKDIMAEKEETEETDVLTTNLRPVKERKNMEKRAHKKQKEKIKKKKGLNAASKAKCLGKQRAQDSMHSLPVVDGSGEKNIIKGNEEKKKENAEEEDTFQEDPTKAVYMSKTKQQNKGPSQECKDALPTEDNLEIEDKQVKQKLEGQREESVTEMRSLEENLNDKMGKRGETERDQNEETAEKGDVEARQATGAEEEAKCSERRVSEAQDEKSTVLKRRVFRGKTKTLQVKPRQHRKKVLEMEKNSEMEKKESFKEKVKGTKEKHVKKSLVGDITACVLKRELPKRKCRRTPTQHQSK